MQYSDKDELTPNILEQVSNKFTKDAWEQFCVIYLNIQGYETENDLPLIDIYVPDVIYKVLQLWVLKNLEDATASNLLEIFKNAKKTGYVNQSAIDYLKGLADDQYGPNQ